jgi:hypothetical protein
MAQQPNLETGIGGVATSSGVRDEHYNLISVLYHSLQAVETCETYIQDAQNDEELASFFRKVQDCNRQCAEEGKQLLGKLLED